MADKQFIPNDPEQILADTIATYQQHAGTRLNPADPERILIDCMTYREMILRAQAERLMQQNFVQYATGDNLDAWGELFGVKRVADEVDPEYRIRILTATKGSIGTYNAYRQRILSVPGVADILIVRKSEDNTLPPGSVRLTPIMTTTSPEMTVLGAVHTPEMERSILDSLNAADFGIIGAVFIFERAVPVPIGGSVNIRSILDYPREQLEKNVKRKIDEYFGGLSLGFDKEFGLYDLERAILSADGVMARGVTLVFNNIPTKGTGEFYVKGETNVSYQ